MASTEGKIGAGIGAAVITAAGVITAALIGTHHSSDDSGGKPSTTSTTSAALRAVAIGRVTVHDPDSPGAWVYSTPVEDPSMEHAGGVAKGAEVQIVCSEQETAGGPGGGLWYKIEYKGGYAFISADSVDLTSDPPPPC